MEHWKDISGYEGIYQVSNFGRIKSLERVLVYSNGRKARHRERIKSQPLDCKTEYRIAVLSKKNIQRAFKISRLVAKAFVSNPSAHPVVNHIDGDKKNDHFLNLEWCTYSYNNLHAFDLGLSKRKLSHTGISWDKSRGKWIAFLYRGNKNLFVGRFHVLDDAIKAVKEFKYDSCANKTAVN